MGDEADRLVEKQTRLGLSYQSGNRSMVAALQQMEAHFNNPNTERKQYLAAKAAGTLPNPDQHLIDLLPEDENDDQQDLWDLI